MDRKDSSQAMQSLMSEYADSDQEEMDTSGEVATIPPENASATSETLASSGTSTTGTSNTFPSSEKTPLSTTLDSNLSSPSHDSKTTSPVTSHEASQQTNLVEDTAIMPEDRVTFVVGGEIVMKEGDENVPSPASIALAGHGISGMKSSNRNDAKSRNPIVAVDEDEIWEDTGDEDDMGEHQEESKIEIIENKDNTGRKRRSSQKKGKVPLLVSYGSIPGDEEEDVDDEEEDGDDEEIESLDGSTEKQDVVKAEASNDYVQVNNEEEEKPTIHTNLRKRSGDISQLHHYLRNVNPDEIEIPPEPNGTTKEELQIKIATMYEKTLKGVDFNKLIQNRKDFRNPSIYDKLILLCGIDEFGSNYPKDIYDPHCWKEHDNYDYLAKMQKIEMDKREKERKERTKVEFVSGTKKSTITGTLSASSLSVPLVDSSLENKGRKTKWDQTQPPPQTSSSNSGKIEKISETTSHKLIKLEETGV